METSDLDTLAINKVICGILINPLKKSGVVGTPKLLSIARVVSYFGPKRQKKTAGYAAAERRTKRQKFSNFLQRHVGGALGSTMDGVSRNEVDGKFAVGLDVADQLGGLVGQLALSSELRPRLRVRVRQVQ